MEIPRPVEWQPDRKDIRWLLQTKLPGEMEYKTSHDIEEIYHAIRVLDIRGAPLIGIGAAYGIAAHVSHVNGGTADLYSEAKKAGERLATARPTAVNLRWAVTRMLSAAKALADRNLSAEEFREGIIAEAIKIDNENAAMTDMIANYGKELLKDGDVVMTHCNAGTLACGGLGTNLAPIRAALKEGKRISVIQTWTAPLLQGARLTALELAMGGIDGTLIADTAVSYAMEHMGVTKVIVGADRILADGRTANKIGTCGIALLARHYKIPFYVAAPTSTVDMKSRDIPIEQRDPNEIKNILGKLKIAPDEIKAANPAFDITPPKYIAAIITEKGIVTAPYRKNFKAIFVR
ncbi:MAG: S-methyl-5-thioribose-1-phosphate isomerase [Candidatus Micrarchaeota archaeon]|nr:S-methyl-5-thioribose-1-phosphate isomerase [Candidatus Micrarchaeota archaeon]